MMQTKEFLEAIHKDNKINFRAIKADSKPININGLYNEYMIDKLLQLNNQGYDIYFVVNGGGTKQAEINKINAVFIDFDCGRDENKQYYSLDKVEVFKNEKLEVIEQFKYQPSLVVETRNGLHVYWLVDNATNEEYLDCQLRLINYFHSDEAVKTLERIMRVPYYWWSKKGYERFMSKVIINNDVRYNIQDIMNVLPEVEKKEIIKKNKTALKLEKPIIKKKESNIDFIKNLDIEGLQSVLFPADCDRGRKGGLIDKYNIYSSIYPPKTPRHIVSNRNEMYKTIGHIDLIEFLGLDSDRFNCIFHEDNNPSAGIFIGNDGNYIYKCFGSSCGFVGGIIRIVERLAKCNKPKAINFIKSVYGIELIESDWQKEQKEILQANIDYLLSNQMQEEYPELYKRIKNYIPLLVVLHNIAMNNVKDENIIDSEDVTFFSSLSNIMNELQSNNHNVTDRINLFALLELIKKLDITEIPEHLLNRAKHEAAKKKQNYLVNFYSIPSYSDEKLNDADDMARLFIEKNMTMKGWSRELLLRTFGKAVADKVYPQFKNIGISESSYKFEKKFTELLLDIINKQGYATEKQCLDILEGYKGLNHVRMKRVLQEVIEKHDLKRIRCNKEIKEKFKVDSEGYPFIIVKNGGI